MTEDMQQKLTAYVDGRLTPAEYAAVEALVRQVPAAAQLLQQLQTDSQCLRSLPKKTVDVVHWVQSRAGQTSRAEVLRQRWIRQRNWQLAACLVLALGLGVIWLVVRGTLTTPERIARPAFDLQAEHAPVEKHTERVQPAFTERKLPPPAFARVALTHAEASQAWIAFQASWEQMKQAANSQWRVVQQLALQHWPNPAQPVPSERILTSPVPGLDNPFKSLEYRLPTLVTLSEMQTLDTAKQFPSGSIYALDIVTSDLFNTWGLLQIALRKSGLAPIVDQELPVRQTRKLPTSVLVFVENLSPEQVQRLLKNLAKESSATSTGMNTSILIQTIDEKGIKWLAGTLGVYPLSLVPHDPEHRKMLGIDPSKPLADETLKSLLKLSAGQGRAGKPMPTVTVALAYGYPRLAPISKELRSTMEQRQGLQPGKLSLVFYLRSAK